VRELRERLDSGLELALDHIPVLAVAALLKEFLRSLPDPLLGAALYPLYMEALECRDEQEKLIRVKRYTSDSGMHTVRHNINPLVFIFIFINFFHTNKHV
jgi:hypothetical protein